MIARCPRAPWRRAPLQIHLGSSERWDTVRRKAFPLISQRPIATPLRPARAPDARLRWRSGTAARRTAPERRNRRYHKHSPELPLEEYADDPRLAFSCLGRRGRPKNAAGNLVVMLKVIQRGDGYDSPRNDRTHE